MSLCIRSFSSGSKYVPTFVTSAQGCVVRRFNSRQLAKHVNPPATSPFLNEFLGSNVPLASSVDIKGENKFSSELINNVHPQLSSNCDVNEVNSSHQYSLEDDAFKKIYVYNNENDPHSHEIIHVPFSNSTKDHLIFSDNLNMFENKVSIIGSSDRWSYMDNRTNITTVNRITKYESKVTFAAKSASAVQEKEVQQLSKNKPTKNPDKKSSENSLEHNYNILSMDLPKLFVKTMDYSIYHPELEFVNNIKGVTTKGIFPYVKKMSLLRLFGHLKYAYVKMEVLKITMHTQDKTIKVRWRIVGITNSKIFFGFWRFKSWKIKEALKECESWIDGFSTFYVGEDGRIFKHVADKIMPDEELEEEKPKTGLSKLAPQLTCSSIN